MKIYDVPNGSRIVLRDRDTTLEMTFQRMDGMYAHCLTDSGVSVHIGALVDVEIVEVGE